MLKYFILIIISILIFPQNSNAQSSRKHVIEGNNIYHEHDYIGAEEAYRKAIEKDANAKAKYNLGNALYQQERYDEAIEQFDDAIRSSDSEEIKSNANFNKGNAYFQKKEYPKSIEAYKNALRLNSQDQSAKENLALAKRYLQEQQKQEQKQEQKQQKQENQKEQEEQEKQEKQTQEEQQNPQDNQDNQSQEEKEKNQEEQEEKEQQQQEGEKGEEGESEGEPREAGDLNKEEAARLLRSVEDMERELQEKLKRKATGENKSDKDW